MNDEPRAGELSESILLRIWSDVPNGAFGLDQTFDAGFGCFAKHEPIHGLAIRAGAQTDESPTDLFWVRARAGTQPEEITASHVVEWNSRRYRVIDAISVGSMRRFTRITAKHLGAI